MKTKDEKTTLIPAQELPPTWQLSTIGDLLKIRNGFAFKSKDYLESGALLIRQANLGGSRVNNEKAKYLPKSYLEEYNAFLVKKGDILIGMSGSIGKLCTYDRNEPALQNQRTGLLLFKDPELKPWVWHYLPLLEKELVKVGKGIAVQNISAAQIESFPIPVAPLEQQKHIVAEIEKQFSRLDEAIANLKRIKTNLKRYKAAVLKSAVEGKLTEAWRKTHPDVEPASQLLDRILTERRTKLKGKGRYKEPDGADETGLPPLPKGWAWARLEQLGMIVGGLTKNPKRAKLTRKLPYLRVANVYANELRLDKIEHIGVQDTELEKLLLRKGDLLIVEGNGSKDQIGRLAIWNGSIDMCVHQNHLIKVRLIIGSIDKWILFWLLSPSGRDCIEKVSSSTSGLYTLSVNKVGALPIILPSLVEQGKIIDEVERHLSVIHELESTVEANLTRANRFRQTLLKSAFTGDLS